MGFIISIIFKTIIGIIGAGYSIDLFRKLFENFKEGASIRELAPFFIALIFSLYIVLWLNHDYIYSIWSGTSLVGRTVVCALTTCDVNAPDHPGNAETNKPERQQENLEPPRPIDSESKPHPTGPQSPPTNLDNSAELAAGAGPSFDCSKAQSSVAKAICGDAELSRLDRLTEKSYDQLQSIDAVSRAALDVKMKLVRGKAACITWRPNEHYKECIQQQQHLALRSYYGLGASVAP